MHRIWDFYETLLIKKQILALKNFHKPKPEALAPGGLRGQQLQDHRVSLHVDGLPRSDALLSADDAHLGSSLGHQTPVRGMTQSESYVI